MKTFFKALFVLGCCTFSVWGERTVEAAPVVKDKPSKKAEPTIPRKFYVEGSRWLKLEWAADHILRFEFGSGALPDASEPIFTSQLYKNAEFPGAKSVRLTSSGRLETTEMSVTVSGLCFSVQDRLRGNAAGSYCMDGMNQPWKTLKVNAAEVQNVYGLGEIFGEPGKMDVDLAGQQVHTTGDFGNIMRSYAGGATSQALFPVAYAMTNTERAWVLALDNIYKQNWDLTESVWKIGMYGDRVSGLVIVGANPLELRKRFMNISGHAPVPPKKMFGFWMSEYGYDDWNEIDDRLNSMRSDLFPIDGFFLDLQWFGNVAMGSDATAMGKLTFDETKFPEPMQRIRNYRNMGIGLIPIEESYIGKALDEYAVMGEKGYLAHECGRPKNPSYLTGEVTGNSSEWWGRGGMIDWSNEKGAAYWHDWKRQNLVNMGLMGHWLDLGEPEMFDRNSCYFGSGEPGKKQHQDIHNIYSLLWAESLYKGYARNNTKQRPFSVIRTGNVGIQRYGAGLWSGDIAGNLESFAAHIGVHSNLSWSGIDYFSSDIGGFHRNRVSGEALTQMETQENFTQWFANGAWFDVPLRTHVMNLGNIYKTAPNRIGHFESNKANLIERYRLIPYYYSLAWQSWLNGTPLMAPMALAYPKDLGFRNTGDQRMLGDILIAAASQNGVYERSVRLPEGLWYDLRTGMPLVSGKGKSSLLNGVPMYINGLFRLPTYARAGAIIPKNNDGAISRFAEGSAKALQNANVMAVDVYIQKDPIPSSFTLFEDDGETIAYKSSEVRRTKISQLTKDGSTIVQFDASEGSYQGALDVRGWLVNVHAPMGYQPSRVMYMGQELNECPAQADDNVVCYRKGRTPGSLVEVRLGLESVSAKRSFVIVWTQTDDRKASAHFTCRDNDPAGLRYYSMYAVGSDSKLGAWDVSKGIALSSNQFLKGIWTGYVSDLPAGENIDWKCVKVYPRASENAIEWQPSDNNHLKTPENGGFAGQTIGSFVRKARLKR